MRALKGIGKTDRERIAAILRGTRGTISVGDVSRILSVEPGDAAKMLSRWTQKGWMSRIARGLYVPVPLESPTLDMPLEDPWLVGVRLYSPCYIGGWSAAEYMDLTEQIFSTIMIMTTRKPRDRNPVIKGQPFLIRTVPENSLFGLIPVWQGRVKVMVSDPARTLLDMLVDPKLGGGIRSVKDMLEKLLKKNARSLEQLIDYADQLGNGSVFKRLGFLLEIVAAEETNALDACRKKMTTGNAKLDPSLDNDRLITRWRLFVPENWKQMVANDR
ncbi:MAG: type IV toxin-antitoxin system AbiEi family antitoxin [Desulfotignum sp.]|nr:type IV toxin-antitoxin system AbiEi family antitoxin [Desulfotignum sp.]